MPDTRSARLAAWQIRLLIVSGTTLWLSGAVWLLLHYYGQVEGDFGAESHPLEPWMLKLHGLALIPSLLGFGGLFVAHVPKGWRDRNRRLVGITLTALVCLLILSGYLLYYVGNDAARSWTSLLHWGFGLSLPVVFLWHYVGRNEARRRRRNRRTSRRNSPA